MFNRGLAGLQASFAPPGQQSVWLNSAPPMQDAGSQVANLMRIQQYGYEQQQRQAMMNAAPWLAKQLNIDLPTAQAIIASSELAFCRSR